MRIKTTYDVNMNNNASTENNNSNYLYENGSGRNVKYLCVGYCAALILQTPFRAMWQANIDYRTKQSEDQIGNWTYWWPTLEMLSVIFGGNWFDLSGSMTSRKKNDWKRLNFLNIIIHHSIVLLVQTSILLSIVLCKIIHSLFHNDLYIQIQRMLPSCLLTNSKFFTC